MANINDIKAFKDIILSDNILVKEGEIYKKSNFLEIGTTLIKYIDIESLIQESIKKKYMFFDTFKSREIYPLLRMTCDIEIISFSNKTLSLKQKPLAINGELRYNNITKDYLDKAILEIIIDKIPEEITGNYKDWLILKIDTPVELEFRKGKVSGDDSFLLLSDITLGKPYKFFYSSYDSRNVWSPFKDRFSGRVECYNSATGLNGYQEYKVDNINSYLRFLNSSEDLENIEENISRSKIIKLRDNNILTKKYISEDEDALDITVLDGKDIEKGVSTIKEGDGVNSLGVKFIRKPEIIIEKPFKQGTQDIGEIKISFNKKFFGLKEFVIGNFICSSLDNDTEYNTEDFPEFAKIFGIKGKTFIVKEKVYKKQQPYIYIDDSRYKKKYLDISEDKFKNFRLVYAPNNPGEVTIGKIGILSKAYKKNYYDPTSLSDHKDISNSKDILSGKLNSLGDYPQQYGISSKSSDAVEITSARNLADVMDISLSEYTPRTKGIELKQWEKDNNNTKDYPLGDEILNYRQGTIMYIILGFK